MRMSFVQTSSFKKGVNVKNCTSSIYLVHIQVASSHEGSSLWPSPTRLGLWFRVRVDGVDLRLRIEGLWVG